MPTLAGGLPYVHSIILYRFAYKFISNLHYLNKIATNTPPLYRLQLYKMRTPLQSVLAYVPYYPPFSLGTYYVSIRTNTKYKSPTLISFPNNISVENQS